MKEPVVADSTCLIALERVEALGILPALFEPVLIPPRVQAEFGVSQRCLTVESPTNDALVSSLTMLVDEGEAAAIALAKQHGVRIILDDRQARSVARQLGLRMIGTVGCALKAKQSGVIAAVRPFLEKLENQGFYLSAALKREALRLAKE